MGFMVWARRETPEAARYHGDGYFTLESVGPDASAEHGVMHLAQYHPPGRTFERYAPEVQTWEYAPEISAWLGVCRFAMPTPTDCARPVLLPGFEMTLGDNNVWTLPRLLYDTQQPALPQVLSICGGQLRTRPMPQFEALASDGLRVWSTLRALPTLGGHPLPPGVGLMDRRELVQFCSSVIALNYRITETGVGLLGLLNDLNYLMVAARVVGLDVYQATRAAEETDGVGKE